MLEFKCFIIIYIIHVMVIMSHWEQATNRINKWQRRNKEVKKERKNYVLYV